jgi:hypothetical protein
MTTDIWIGMAAGFLLFPVVAGFVVGFLYPDEFFDNLFDWVED